MIKNENSNESIGKEHHCGAMCGGRNSGLFLGVLFIVVGLYWFGKIAGWFPPEIKMFWPLVFILTGTWFIVATLTKKRDIIKTNKLMTLVEDERSEVRNVSGIIP